MTTHLTLKDESVIRQDYLRAINQSLQENLKSMGDEINYSDEELIEKAAQFGTQIRELEVLGDKNEKTMRKLELTKSQWFEFLSRQQGETRFKVVKAYWDNYCGCEGEGSSHVGT